MNTSRLSRVHPAMPHEATSEPITAGAGERLSFEEVYEKHFDYVYRVISRLSGERDVDDLVQDVFAVVHQRLGDFEGRAQLTTWLFRIALRVVGAHVRRERLRRRCLALFGLGKESPAASDPEIARAVRRALDSLSFKKRTVLVLVEVEGWSCTEIGDKLGVPVDTVYTRLYHARRELAHRLGSGESRA